MLYEARDPRGDQVLYSWWSHGDSDFDDKKVRYLESRGYVVKSLMLKRGN